VSSTLVRLGSPTILTTAVAGTTSSTATELHHYYRLNPYERTIDVLGLRAHVYGIQR